MQENDEFVGWGGEERYTCREIPYRNSRMTESRNEGMNSRTRSSEKSGICRRGFVKL